MLIFGFKYFLDGIVNFNNGNNPIQSDRGTI